MTDLGYILDGRDVEGPPQPGGGSDGAGASGSWGNPPVPGPTPRQGGGTSPFTGPQTVGGALGMLGDPKMLLLLAGVAVLLLLLLGGKGKGGRR